MGVPKRRDPFKGSLRVPLRDLWGFLKEGIPLRDL